MSRRRAMRRRGCLGILALFLLIPFLGLLSLILGAFIGFALVAGGAVPVMWLLGGGAVLLAFVLSCVALAGRVASGLLGASRRFVSFVRFLFRSAFVPRMRSGRATRRSLLRERSSRRGDDADGLPPPPFEYVDRQFESASH